MSSLERLGRALAAVDLSIALAATAIAGQIRPAASAPLSQPAPATPAAGCPVTPYAATPKDPTFTSTWYGGGDFWAGLDRAYDGQWFAGPAGLKVGWVLPGPGSGLSVEGQRLDGRDGPPLQLSIPSDYGGGFQPSTLVFPTPGCWAVTARVGERALRFVVLVHPADPNPARAGPRPGSDFWQPLRRPLRLPPLAAGGACPVSTIQRVSRIDGAVLGVGPIYAGGLGSEGTVNLAGLAIGPATLRATWIADPRYQGPVLIRGRQLDAASELRFGTVGGALPEYAAGWRQAAREPDWRIWDVSVQVPAAGCYAFQIDGRDFSEVIVFQATTSDATGAVGEAV